MAFAVVPHHERQQPTGRGYVVRTYSQGQCEDSHNYGGVCPVRIYQRRADAERLASKLTHRPIVSYWARVQARTGTLLGGGRDHTSSRFSCKSDAENWARAVVETNQQAGADPDPCPVIEESTRAPELARNGAGELVDARTLAPAKGGK